MRLNKEQTKKLLVDALVAHTYSHKSGSTSTVFLDVADLCDKALVEPFVGPDITNYKEIAYTAATLVGIALYQKDQVLANQLIKISEYWLSFL